MKHMIFSSPSRLRKLRGGERGHIMVLGAHMKLSRIRHGVRRVNILSTVLRLLSCTLLLHRHAAGRLCIVVQC